MAPCTCKPPPASSPIRYLKWNGRKPKTRRARCYVQRSRCRTDWTGRSDMLLMIDNYDSFTYNLVQYFGELGEDVRTFRNDEITLEQIAAMKPDRICISPGPCTPHEAGVSVPVLQEFAGKTPILGVCLGHQG